MLINGQPVFYLLNEDGSVFFFGHTRMLRVPYPRTPQDYIPEALRRESTLDLAEALFGYVKGKDKLCVRAEPAPMPVACGCRTPNSCPTSAIFG